MWGHLKYLKDYNNIIDTLYLFVFIYFKIFKANLVFARFAKPDKIQTYENKEK